MNVSILMPVIFALGILAIAFEDKIKVNKAASALLMALLLWVLYATQAVHVLGAGDHEMFEKFVTLPRVAGMSPMLQYMHFIVDLQLVKQLGDISETLFFVMCLMIIIELVDIHGGFLLITEKIHTENKRRLLWIVGITSFITAALMDNLATAIVMIAMLQKLIPHSRERWIYSSMVVIAANAGGSWSPIGDVTTILLWTGGQVTPLHQISHLFLPALVCLVTALLIISRFFGKDDRWDRSTLRMPESEGGVAPVLSTRNRTILLVMGILSMVMVPVFNMVTGLPPFMGVLLGLVIMWIFTDLLFGHDRVLENQPQYRVSHVLSRIDLSTILFFLGILLSVGALQSTGQLQELSTFFDTHVGQPLVISFLIGLLSSVLDNVALVAGTIGMYPMNDTLVDGVAYFAPDGPFWTFLAYCGVTGGSIFIIGSATGVSVMGLEKISFSYYFKRFTLVALCGYVAGAGTYLLLNLLF